MSRSILIACSVFGLAACQPAAETSAAEPDPQAVEAPAPAPTPPTGQTTAAPAPAATPGAAAADPVAAFLERAELCAHWGGEEGFDEARQAQINEAMTRLNCEALIADGQALKASTPAAAARIDEALAPFV